MRLCVVTFDFHTAVKRDQMKTADRKGEKRKDGSPILLLLYLLSQVRNLKLPLTISVAQSHIPNPMHPPSQRPLHPGHPFLAPAISPGQMASIL